MTPLCFLLAFVFLGTRSFIQKSLKGKKKKQRINMLSTQKMMRSGNAFSSHSGLIPSEKRGGLLWPIARKENLISLRSAAFFTIFEKKCSLVHAYKFHVNFFFKKLDNPEIKHQFTSPLGFKDIEKTEGY